MKLSIEIFYYQLQEQSSGLIIERPVQGFNISEVRVYMPGISLRPDILYIGPADLFFHNQDATPICYNCGNYILFPDMDLFALLNAALEVFHHFATWEERCQELLEEHAPLSDLLNTGEEIIQFPLLVVDESQFIISHSTSMSEAVSLSVDNIRNHRSLPIELLQEFNRMHADSFKAQKTFWLPDDFFPTESAGHHIFDHDMRVGTVIVAYTGEPDHTYLSQMIELFVPILQKWFFYAKNADSSANSTSLLAQALDGKPESHEELAHYLHLFGWDTKQPMQLFFARSLSENVHFDSHLSRSLNNEINGIFCIPYEKSLTILCNYGLISEDTFSKQLKQLLIRSNYYSISSSVFTDLALLPDLYQQILIAAKQIRPEVGMIYPGSRTIFPLIAQTVDKHLRLPVIHPVLEQMLAYDAQKNTSYFETLYTYLRHERNHQRTAEALFVHRNTLFLRLRKIDELWGLDLDDPDLRFDLLYCFYHLQMMEQRYSNRVGGGD